MDLEIHDWSDVDVLTSHEFKQLFRFLRFWKVIDLPLAIRKTERPDFIISSLKTGSKTGVEITWAANQPWEEAQAYLSNTKQPGYYQVSRNWLARIRETGRVLGQHLQTRQSDSPIWHSKEHAEAKAREVRNAILRKTESLSKPTYQLFDSNWLLIFDKNPFLFLDVQEFRQSMRVIDLGDLSRQYDAIYFVTQLRNRSRRENEDVLFQLSGGDTQIIGEASQRTR